MSAPPGPDASVGTVEDLQASATRITGADRLRQRRRTATGSSVLLESYARESGLTTRQRVARAGLRDALVARLL